MPDKPDQKSITYPINRKEYKGFPKHVRERIEDRGYQSVPPDPDRLRGIK